MRTIQKLDFQVDKDNRKIHVTREFASNVANVWAAWTKAELLDQWWAPHPWQAKTKKMDFREGGMWLYAMVGPEGENIWARLDYVRINALKSFNSKDAFCDENGVINESFPRMLWNNVFKDQGDATTVAVEISFSELADLEKIIEMGFKEGFTAALENLDELIGQLSLGNGHW
jgi:uncharacterized protein YndB with AHSA1/START domain